MKNEVILIVAIVLIYVLNAVFSMIQMKEFNLSLKRIKNMNYPYVSIGKKTKYVRKGSIAIITADDVGRIGYCEILQGMTVFAKFKKIEGIEGLSITEAKNRFEKNESIYQAIGYIEEKFSTCVNDVHA